jgi:D-xylose 1-dehydrogenase (NADP+, D-xylono-1,5-lactone-forming)
MTDLRWGILGTAHIATTVAAAIGRSEGNRVVAVASREPARAQQWATDHEVEHAFGSYDSLLESKTVDVIYIPLPNTMHAAWTIRSLEAGYPVLCEKPLAMNASQAQKVIEAALKAGQPVAEGYMYRFHPLYDKILELLDSGVVGNLVSILSQFSFFEDDRSSIVASPEMGGGSLMDVGCYCVDVTRMIARSEPLRVSALSTGRGIDETLIGTMEFPGNILASFESSIASTERHRLEIVGTTGTIVVPDPWLPGLEETRILIDRWGQAPDIITVSGADTYRLEVEDFAQAIRTQASPRWSLADAKANLAVIDALLRSARDRCHGESALKG